MDIDEIKSYSKIDFNDEDLSLDNLRSAAVLYLKGAGVLEKKNNAEYDLAIKMLVDHWYNNRGILSKGYEMPYGFASIIVHLKE